MRLRSLPLVVGGVVTTLVAATVAAVPAAAAPPTDFFSMTADTRPVAAGGPGGTLVATDQQVALTSSSAGQFAATGTATAPAGDIAVAFTAPTGSAFAIKPSTGKGDYDLAATATKNVAGVSATFAGTACQVTDGTLTVTRLTTGDSGITAVQANFQINCAGGTRFYGNFGIGTGTPYNGQAFASGAGPRDLGQLPVGEQVQVPVDFTYTGPDTTTGFAVSPSLDDVDDFSVASNTCSDGRVLTNGDVCTVTVALTPTDVGTRGFELVLGDNDALAAVVFTAYDPDLGTYHAATQRLVDTRDGTGAPRQKVGAGRSITVVVPNGTNASAAVVNLTVTNPTVAGFVTAYPAGATRPTTSSINFVPGQTVANLVTVPVSADGQLSLFNAYGTTDLVVDLVGWYANAASDGPRGGGYHPTLSERLLDTRDPSTWSGGQLPPGYYATVPVRYQDDGGHIAALAVNVTATNVRGQGFITTWNAATDSPPLQSTLNVTPGQIVANAAIVPSSYCPAGDGCSANATIGIYNGTSGPLDLVADISGYYDDGNLPATVRYQPLAAPTRVIDTRTPLGLTRFTSNQTQVFQPTTAVAGYDTIALDTNVTGITADGATFVTAWPNGFSDYPKPNTSVINPSAGRIVAGHATTEVGPGNRVNYYNLTGRLDLVLDVDGTFEEFPPTPVDQQGKAKPSVTPARPVATTAPHPRAAH